MHAPCRWWWSPGLQWMGWKSHAHCSCVETGRAICQMVSMSPLIASMAAELSPSNRPQQMPGQLVGLLPSPPLAQLAAQLHRPLQHQFSSQRHLLGPPLLVHLPLADGDLHLFPRRL